MDDIIFLQDSGQVLANTSGVDISQAGPETLILTNEAPQSIYQAILHEVYFQNTADEPGSVERLIQFNITDGTFSSTAFTTVNIIPTNDPAFLNFTTRELTFDESTRTPVSLFSQSDILIDPDANGGMLQWLTVEIVSPDDPSDMLVANALDNNLAISNNASQFLNISGSGNFTQYQAALATVMYYNNFPGMNTTNRTINVLTFDGTTISFVHSVIISVIPFDDQPRCYFDVLVSS